MTPADAPSPQGAAPPGQIPPEVLAPAGDPLALRAAIAAGADAVYLGMARFNARGRAERFRGVTLAACVRAAHEHGVRVYVTLNTLLHEDEIPAALGLAREALDAGVDAAIVQDIGFAGLLRTQLPGLPLHGSTQMTVHQADQAAAAVVGLGLRRVIVARECSVEEVSRIAERLRPLGAGVEVFVHGALCYAYSGQCLMSNFAGRRSANRGICAQNCRFDFTAGAMFGPGLIPLPAFDRRAASQLISMKDLAAFESVAALADAGAGSFKIEGRLKGAEYVAEVTRLYRAALDAWQEGRQLAAAEAERAAGRVFSRGPASWWGRTCSRPWRAAWTPCGSTSLTSPPAPSARSCARIGRPSMRSNGRPGRARFSPARDQPEPRLRSRWPPPGRRTAATPRTARSPATLFAGHGRWTGASEG